jgi:hypothetical protein
MTLGLLGTGCNLASIHDRPKSVHASAKALSPRYPEFAGDIVNVQLSHVPQEQQLSVGTFKD